MTPLENKTILVAGASGLVGSHMLIKLCQTAAGNIRAVYHRTPPQVHHDRIAFVRADLTSREECRKVLNGIDIVFMFAARIDRRPANWGYLIDNVAMTFNMLEAASLEGVEQFIWLSSATAYPPSDSSLKETQMDCGEPYGGYAPYAHMIRYLERMCRMYAEKGMRVTVLRPTAIYGEYGDFDLSTCHVLPALIRRVVERQRPLVIWGTGETRRDFIHAADVVDACLISLAGDRRYGCFNIGAGTLLSVRELLGEIIKIEGFEDAEIIFDPDKESKAPVISLDTTKAKRILGFEAKVSLAEGIRRSATWLKEEMKTATTAPICKGE